MDEIRFVQCPECGSEQADMGRNVACEECGHGPMPSESYGDFDNSSPGLSSEIEFRTGLKGEDV